MKKIFGIMVIIVLSMVSSFGINTKAHAQFVHYEAGGKLSSKRPDFKGAKVAINIGGSAGLYARNEFLKLGAQDIALPTQGTSNPCYLPEATICVDKGSGQGVNTSGYSNSSGYGNNGGYSNQSSFSGQLYNVFVTVSIIHHTKNGNKEFVPVGTAFTLAPAGMSSETIASYGRTSSGMLSYTATSGLDATVGKAITDDVTELLEPGKWRRAWAAKLGANPWVLDADLDVRKAIEESNATDQVSNQ
jgi:hypothetical protein